MLPADPPPSTAPAPLDYQRGGVPVISPNRRRVARLLLFTGWICILGSVGSVGVIIVLIFTSTDGSGEWVSAGLVFIPLVMLLSLIPITFGVVYLICARKIRSGGQAWLVVALVMASLQELQIAPAIFNNPFTDKGWGDTQSLPIAIWLACIGMSVLSGFTIYYLIRILREPRIYEEGRLRRHEA